MFAIQGLCISQPWHRCFGPPRLETAPEMRNFEYGCVQAYIPRGISSVVAPLRYHYNYAFYCSLFAQLISSPTQDSIAISKIGLTSCVVHRKVLLKTQYIIEITLVQQLFSYSECYQMDGTLDQTGYLGFIVPLFSIGRCKRVKLGWKLGLVCIQNNQPILTYGTSTIQAM